MLLYTGGQVDICPLLKLRVYRTIHISSCLNRGRESNRQDDGILMEMILSNLVHYVNLTQHNRERHIMSRNISTEIILDNVKLLKKGLDSIEDYWLKQLQAYIDKDEDKFNYDLEDFEDVEEAADELFVVLQEEISDLIADCVLEEQEWTQADRDALSRELSMDEGQETAEEVFMDAVADRFPYETSADWLEDFDQFNCLENSG